MPETFNSLRERIAGGSIKNPPLLLVYEETIKLVLETIRERAETYQKFSENFSDTPDIEAHYTALARELTQFAQNLEAIAIAPAGD